MRLIEWNGVIDLQQESTDWQSILKQSFIKPQQMLEMLEIDSGQIEMLPHESRRFPVQASKSFLSKIKKGDSRDPLFLQIWPQHLEDRTGGDAFQADCVGEFDKCDQGIIQKYHGRVLAITTGACAIHCRYCFRRDFPYGSESFHFDQLLRRLEDDASIQEVILSGGDPLVLTDRKLDEYVQRISEFDHVRSIRFHSRLITALPERFTPELMSNFETWQRLKPIIFVLHTNHANELGSREKEICHGLHRLGVQLFNQSVLLSGINDAAVSLCDLSWRLNECLVKPYYLHLLDRAQGTAHFEVPLDSAMTLVEEMRAQLPGYLVPQLVREIPDAPAKTPANQLL